MKTLEGKKVLVTGATGFIGSHLVRAALEAGAETAALARPGSSLSRLSGVLDRVELVRADLLDRRTLTETVRSLRPQVIFHLAAVTDVSRGLASLDRSLADLRAAMNVVCAVEAAGTERLVHTGTCEEYGDNEAPFTEDQPPNPVSPYSASKAAATLYLRMFHKTTGLPVVILRPFLTYGPGQSPRRLLSQAMLSALTGRALDMTAGEQTREFNYVSDVVDGIMRAAAAEGVEGEIINIGCGEERRVRDVVEEVYRAAGAPLNVRFGALPYREGEAMRFYCDNSKARRLLGWRPGVGLAEGIRLTLRWLEEEGLEAEREEQGR